MNKMKNSSTKYNYMNKLIAKNIDANYLINLK